MVNRDIMKSISVFFIMSIVGRYMCLVLYRDPTELERGYPPANPGKFFTPRDFRV